jgi:hypothetical protein
MKHEQQLQKGSQKKMIRSINDFANQVPTSYATKENSRRAFDKKIADAQFELRGTTLTVERADGRWVTLFINPDSDTFFFALHCANIPVYGTIN